MAKINLQSINHYLSLYTDVDIKKTWNQLSVWKHIVDIDWKYTAMVIYISAIASMLEAKKMTTISAFYFQDLVTMLLKEVAKAEDIDPSQYRWSADLIKQFPELWVFYNTVEWFKLHAQATASWLKTWVIDFPLEFLTEVLDWLVDKYIIWISTASQKKEANTSIQYWKSIDDIM